MKIFQQLILSIMFILNALPIAYAQDSECVKEYRKSLARKESRYKKAYDRYKQRRKNAQNAIFSSGGGLSAGSIFGSAVLQNDSAPRKSDYNMYEEDILKAYEEDTSSSILRSKLLEKIYNKSYEKYPDITYDKIQYLIKKGFNQNKFCGFFGKYKSKKISRYILKQLKKEDHDVLFAPDRSISSTNTELKLENKIEVEDVNIDLEASDQ